MAEREGLRKSRLLNDLGWLTGQNGTIDAKGKSGGLSNRHELTIETKTPTTAATEAGAMYIQSVGASENYGGFLPVARGVFA